MTLSQKKNSEYIKKIKLLSENFVKNAFKIKKTKKRMNINYFVNNAIIYKQEIAQFNYNTTDDILNNLSKINNLTNIVSYTLTVRQCKTNVFFIFANILKVTKLNYSAGLLKIKKKQRRKKPSVYFHMIKHLVQNLNFEVNSPIALHFYNIIKTNKKMILTKLMPIFNFSALRYFVLKPHNGCREKKLKRIKKRVKK